MKQYLAFILCLTGLCRLVSQTVESKSIATLSAVTFGMNQCIKTPASQSSFSNTLGLKVIERSELGYPVRFICNQSQIYESSTPSSYWAAKLPSLLGLTAESAVGYVLQKEETDLQGNIHLKYEQTFDSLPVLDGQYYVHVYPEHRILAHGHLLIPEKRITPLIRFENIPSIVETYFKAEPGSIKVSTIPALGYWLEQKSQQWHLVYKTHLQLNNLQSWILWIDTQNGKVLKSLLNQCNFHSGCKATEQISETSICKSSAIQHRDHGAGTIAPDGAETTMAKDLTGTTRQLQVWREGTDVYLLDASKPMFQPAMFNLNAPKGAIWTLDAKNSSNPVPGTGQISSKNNTWTPLAVSAHYNAGEVYNYFYKTHGRNSIDGKGGTIQSFINFSQSYSGAFWTNNTIYYGNGNVNQGYYEFAKGLDISAHEISHGVIDATAGLEYDAESGAVNESFADIFAVMVDRDDWTLGEDVIVQGHPIRPSGAERNMANPGQGLPKDSFRLGWQPNHVNQEYKGLNDGGGVHWNSGIPNHAFYQFVQGLIPMAGNEEGAKKIAEKVYYHALQYYLTRQAGFSELRAAIEQSCADLYPGNQDVRLQAGLAFDKVGIKSGAEPGGGIFDIKPSELSVNPGTEFVICTKFNSTSNRNEGLYLRDMSTQNLKQISALNILSKPSVTDNGQDIYVVGSDSKVYRLHYNLATSTYEQSLFLDQAIYRNVCVSKDGRFLALLQLPAQNNNKIVVRDISTQQEKTFTISNPVAQTGIQSSTVTQIGSLDFHASGQYLMYDCNSANQIVGGNTFQQWDIGFLRFWNPITDQFGDGGIEKLFRAPLADIGQNVIYHFRNPVFAKNSPYVIALDFYSGNFNNQTYNNSFSIIGANVEKGELKYIQYQRAGMGFPDYSIEDDSLSYDDGFLSPTRPGRISTVDLDVSKIDSSGSSLRLLNGYRWATRFGNGMRRLVNSIPYVQNDSYTIDEDQTLNDQVSANDQVSLDGNNQWKLKGSNGGALHGTVMMNPNGSFSYIPQSNFYGDDQFVYELCDADSDCASAIANITIRSVNDLPVVKDDNFKTKQNQKFDGDVSQNDLASGDGGNKWKLDGSNGGAAHGTVSMDLQGQYSYTPNPGYFGNDVFNYTLCDADQDCTAGKVFAVIEQVVANKEASSEKEFKLVPTIVDKSLRVLSVHPDNQLTELRIFNLMGSDVIHNKWSAPFPETELDIDVSLLSPGIYVVELQTTLKRSTYRIIKK